MKRLIPMLLALVFSALAPTLVNAQVTQSQCWLSYRVQGGAPIYNCVQAIPSVASPSAEFSRVLLAAPGQLYNVYAANATATAGFLLILNSTTVPADGVVTPLDCVALPANGNATLSFNPGPASAYSTGITAVLSSGANCFTKTTGVITGFIKASVTQ